MIGSSVTALLALAMRRSLHLPNAPSVARAPLRVLLRPRVRKRMLLGLVLGICKLGTYWSCYTWLPAFLKQMGVPVARSLAWILTAQVGQFLGMMTFGAVSDRFGRRPAFCAFSVLTACAIAPIALSWHWLLDHRSYFWITMFFLGVGSGCTAGFGALLAELFPSDVRTTAMGTTYNLARAAQLATPVLVAWMVSLDGIRGGLAVPFVLALATASWVWTLPETRGIELPALQEEDAMTEQAQ